MRDTLFRALEESLISDPVNMYGLLLCPPTSIQLREIEIDLSHHGILLNN